MTTTDSYDLIGEVGPSGSLVRSYVWGPDLSGTMHGAGGVGGLLEVSYYGSSTTNCFAAYDGNGNLTALANAADGTVAARYEYGPFGEVIRMTGPMAKVNPFRSSTKYQDDETDLIYYGFRYLKTSTGAWLSRDPVADLGFGMQNGGTDAEQRDNAGQNIANLYCFVGNQPLSRWDNLGLEVAGGGVPSTSWLEHKNTLTFTISCPYGRYYYFDHVDYSGAVPGLENTFGKQRVDSLAGSIPPAAGLGGLDKLIGTNPRGVNCWAQPSTTVVHMRSRFTSPAPWFAGTKSAAGVTAYSAGTVVYYYCVRCTCQLPPMPPPDTGTGHVNDPTF